MLGFAPLADAPTGGSPVQPKIVYADGAFTAAGAELAGQAFTEPLPTITSGILTAGVAQLFGEANIVNTIYADGTLAAAAADFFGSDLFRREIRTPRPPLNLFEATRRSTTLKRIAGWVYIDQPPTYLIEDPINPGREVEGRYILTRVTVTGGPSNISLRIINYDDKTYRTIFESLDIAGDPHVELDLQRAILKAQDVIQMRVNSGNDLDVTFSYVTNLREEYEVIS
jgi:hypothetical protein